VLIVRGETGLGSRWIWNGVSQGAKGRWYGRWKSKHQLHGFSYIPSDAVIHAWNPHDPSFKAIGTAQLPTSGWASHATVGHSHDRHRKVSGERRWRHQTPHVRHRQWGSAAVMAGRDSGVTESRHRVIGSDRSLIVQDGVSVIRRWPPSVRCSLGCRSRPQQMGQLSLRSSPGHSRLGASFCSLTQTGRRSGCGSSLGPGRLLSTKLTVNRDTRNVVMVEATNMLKSLEATQSLFGILVRA
jgi:hypothetical protein